MIDTLNLKGKQLNFYRPQARVYVTKILHHSADLIIKYYHLYLSKQHTMNFDGKQT